LLRIIPEVCLYIIEDGYYPSLSHREMLMSVHQEELLQVASVGASNLHQWRVGAGNIYVLLSF
jgi:hypothetical protein